MPIKTLICKECNSSFVAETTIQKSTETCGVCIKKLSKEENDNTKTN